MSDQKITQLTALTALSADDLMVVVNDPGGSPQTMKMTVANFYAYGLGRGFVPIGSVVGVLTAMTGCPVPTTADGWAACNGTTIAAQGVTGSVITDTQATPNINAGAFIRGAGTSWSTGAASGGADSVTSGAGSSHTHTSAAHTHTMGNHTHTGPSHTHTGPSHTHTATSDAGGTGATGASGTGATGAGSAHSHTLSHGHTVDNHVHTINHTHGGGNLAGTGPTQVLDAPFAGNSGLTSPSTDVFGGASGNESSHTHAGPSHTHSGPSHTHTLTSDAGGTGATGAGGTGASGAPSNNTSDSTTPGATGSESSHTHSVATLPVYFSAVYYMRCK